MDSQGGVFAGAVGILLWLFRTKDASIRLSVWTAVLGGVLLIPIVASTVPRLSISFQKPEVVQNLTLSNENSNADSDDQTMAAESQPQNSRAAQTPVWPSIAFGIWLAITMAMLSRLILGLRLNRRLVREATTVENGLCESASVYVPVTVGLMNPVILLPLDWRDWEMSKLQAVLAHERAHVARRDTVRQFFSAIYKSVCWFNPMAWWLDAKLASLAESASDDAAISAIKDPVLYAETLLSFLERAGQERVRYQVGVGMAKMGNASKRIERILDSDRRLSQSVTGRGLVVLAIIVVPLILFIASIEPGWEAKAFGTAVESASPQTASSQPPDFAGQWYSHNSHISFERIAGSGTSKTGQRLSAPPPPPIGKTEKITREGDVLKIAGGPSAVGSTHTINLSGSDVVETMTGKDGSQTTRTGRSKVEGRNIITDWKMERDGKNIAEGQEIRSLSEDGKVQTIDSTWTGTDGVGFKVHVVMKRVPMLVSKEIVRKKKPTYVLVPKEAVTKTDKVTTPE